MNIVSWLIVLLVIIVLITLLYFFNIGLWFRALVSGVHVSLGQLASIAVKKLDVKYIVKNYIKARKAGIAINIIQIENHIQAQGNIESVIDALIAAHNANIPLRPETAIAVDLSGRNISDAVKHCITPQVIQVNNITAIAKNGIEVTLSMKITLRINLKRIIGGALEETIIARVAESAMTIVGNSQTHNELLERPDIITSIIGQNKTIANDTCFDIISVDVSEIKVGRNVGAELEIDKAEAEKFISQADAERRRAEAVASEQEMRALTQEMRARVVAAESELPRAIAGALSKGNIDVPEYFRLENMKSDTAMRNSLSGVPNSDMLTNALPAPKKKSKLQ